MYGNCFSVECLTSCQCQVIDGKILNIMEWIPIVFVIFKVLVLGTGMFYAIKWHFDRVEI